MSGYSRRRADHTPNKATPWYAHSGLGPGRVDTVNTDVGILGHCCCCSGWFLLTRVCEDCLKCSSCHNFLEADHRFNPVNKSAMTTSSSSGAAAPRRTTPTRRPKRTRQRYVRYGTQPMDDDDIHTMEDDEVPDLHLPAPMQRQDAAAGFTKRAKPLEGGSSSSDDEKNPHEE